MVKPDGPYHHGNLRAALLERAESHLASEGSHDLSLRRLAREIGVSHDAPRHHFPTKQVLYESLAQRGFTLLGEEIEATLGHTSGPFASRLLAFVQAYIRFARSHPALLELMFAAKTSAAGDHLRQSNDRTFAPAVALIAEGQEAGELLPGDPDPVYMALWTTMQGLSSLITGGLLEDRDPDQVVTRTTEILLAGLHPSASRSLNRAQVARRRPRTK